MTLFERKHTIQKWRTAIIIMSVLLLLNGSAAIIGGVELRLINALITGIWAYGITFQIMNKPKTTERKYPLPY